jgi:hypothetical protein
MEVSMSSEQGSVSRRAFIRGAVGAAIASRGVYALLDDFITPQRAQAAAVVARRQEQYLIDSLEVILDNNTTVVVPPIFNDVITAKLKATGKTWDKAALKTAQSRLESALATVEKPYPATAAGLTVVVAWGLPYFRSYVSGPWGTKAPRLLPLTLNRLAVEDAIRFPSDPSDVVLEDNHVAFKIRSDHASTLQSVEAQLFDATAGSSAYVGDLFDVTSKRVGFAGRGFDQVSEAKQRAVGKGVPGASEIPARAQLMMGFTSTQTEALGPDNIPSFETLRGVTDQFPSGYFAHGCAMHLSHLYLDIATWYTRSYGDRVRAMMSTGTTVPTDQTTVTMPNGPAQVVTAQQVKDDAATQRRVGHNEALQTATRLASDTLDNYGRLRRKGTGVPAREDFNTLDDPFACYLDAGGTVRTPSTYAAGLHFAVFIPATSKFHAARLAMDGMLPDGTNLRDTPVTTPDGVTHAPNGANLSDAQIGINSAMHATHRQNYLVPPRAHRSFPLAELL